MDELYKLVRYHRLHIFNHKKFKFGALIRENMKSVTFHPMHGSNIFRRNLNIRYEELLLWISDNTFTRLEIVELIINSDMDEFDNVLWNKSTNKISNHQINRFMRIMPSY